MLAQRVDLVFQFFEGQFMGSKDRGRGNVAVFIEIGLEQEQHDRVKGIVEVIPLAELTAAFLDGQPSGARHAGRSGLIVEVEFMVT